LLAVVACARAQIFYNSWPYGGITYSASPVTYTSAGPVTYSAPTLVATAPVAVPLVTKTQYHAQDELGQASYGYSHPGHAHAAVRDAAGGVRGSYAYINPDGKEVRVNYVADSVGGFRVESNDLPVGPAVPVVAPLLAPAPVQDTPEVAAAKAEHMKAVEDAKIRNAEADKKDAEEAKETPAPAENKDTEEKKERRKRQVIAYSAPTAIAYSHVLPATPIVAAPAVRTATLTKVINTPGHAVSYRVD